MNLSDLKDKLEAIKDCKIEVVSFNGYQLVTSIGTIGFISVDDQVCVDDQRYTMKEFKEFLRTEHDIKLA